MGLLIAAFSCTALAGQEIWDVERLRQTPRVWPAEAQAAQWIEETPADSGLEWAFSGEGVRPLFYEGLPWQGKPTRVFAWYGVPERTGDEKVPAVVLAHGGGGTAFDEWVRQWTRRGFAAISMDLTGSRPGGQPGQRPRHDWAGPPHGDDIGEAPLSPAEQWVYHAVADVALANSLLRSFPEVDPDRTGLVGISWGGFLSAIVPAVDRRFAFSVPIYGCGYLAETPIIGKSWQTQDQQLVRRWTDLWDPSSYVGDIACPTLWLNGANDPHFPIDLHARTVAHCGGVPRLSVQVGLAHSHVHGWLPEEPYAFAGEVLRSGEPMVVVQDHGVDEGKAWVSVADASRVASATLVHSADTGPWEACNWHEEPVVLAPGSARIEVDLPKSCRRWFFNLRDPRGVVTSTKAVELPDDRYFELRSGISNSVRVFRERKAGRVVFLGGSITTMPGWRDLTCDMLRERFPETAFDFIDAGIGGTDSTLGAFRFEEDVFEHGPVDLLFLEFAVNDGPGVRARRGMEGIIRRARRLNPAIDIVVQYFVDTGKRADYSAGKTPQVIQDHDRVVRHYGLPIINMAWEMTRRLDAGEFVWSQFSGDTCHPSPFGHARYAACIGRFLDVAWAEPGTGAPENRTLPQALDPMNYEHGRFVDPTEAEVIQGWRVTHGWETEKTCNYGGPVDVFTGEAPGDVLELAFEGTVVGYYGIAGMDAGVLEYTVDGGQPKTLDLFDHYCRVFHRPVCHLLAEDLDPGEHRLKLRISAEKNAESQGNACRILRFLVN